MSEAALNYSSEVDNFLESLFEGQSGYVYTPTLNLATAYWQPYFFKWPEQRTVLVTHILDATQQKDVYVAPSLFKAPSDKKQAWKGSNYVWIEFDGNAPDSLPSGIPNPTIRVQSSTKGHEHWYWKLSEFETDYRVLEGLSKQLTYTLDADKSGWDCSQVLRPPGTLHQESRRRVRLIRQDSRTVDYGDFKNLVEPPESVVLDTAFEDVPDSAEVVSKYKWEKEAWSLFQKQSQPQGSRSSAMTRLAFHCVEMGMTNEECYSILYNADERWGKFKKREPAERAKRLLGIISHCRGKKALENELLLSQRDHFLSLGDFRKRKIKVKWLFTNFLAEQGFGIISSAPGVGKSTLSFRMGFEVCTGKDFLGFENAAGPKRVGFVSLEMQATEIQKFLDDMTPSLSEEDSERIDRNFFLLDRGYNMNLWDKNNQQMILEDIDNFEIDFLIIDSLKAAGGLDEKHADNFYNWVNEKLRKERGITVWVIHHNRKPPNEGPRKPRGLEDLYGDQYIGAHATTVIALWREGTNTLEVIPMKMRLSEMPEPFPVFRTNELVFIRGEAPATEETTPVAKSAGAQLFKGML